MEYKSVYQRLIVKLKSVRREENLLNSLSSISLVFSALTILVFVTSFIELFAQGDSTFRTILFFSILAIWIGFGIYQFLPLYNMIFGKKKQSELDIALRVGNYYKDVKDNLCNSLQLVEEIDQGKALTSKELALAAFEQTAKISENKDYSVIIDKKKPKTRLIYFFAMLAIVCSSLLIFQSTLGASLYRVINFSKSFLPPAPFSLELLNSDQTVLRGSQIIIKVKANGTAPENIRINIKEDNQKNFDSYKLILDSGNYYTYQIPSIRGSITVYADADWLNSKVESKEIKITVTDKPQIKSISGIVVQPSYSGLPPKRLDEQNLDITALKGSNVQLHVISSKDLSGAEIMIEHFKNGIDTGKVKADTSRIRMNVKGKEASGNFSITSNFKFFVKIRDINGQENENPITYNVVALYDESPSISLLEPSGDTQLGEDALLHMTIGIADDYGFSSLKLHYKLLESKYTESFKDYKTVNIPIIYNGTALEIPYLWDLNKLGISPEDKYEYYLEVFDNDRINGFKSAKTRTYTLRLPSLEEVLKSSDQAQKKVETDLEKMLKKAEEIKKNSEELNRELLKNDKDKNLKWQDKKKAEEIVKKQDELMKKMDELQKSMQDVTNKLQENKALSPETLQKYKELQQLMKEVNSPELNRMRDRMQKALENMNQDQLQKAMKDFKFDEDKFKQSIERSLKILKRLQAEQKTDALTKRAEDLKKKQDELEKKLENTNAGDKAKKDEIARQEKNLKDDLNKLSKELDDLEKLMKEFAKDMPMKDLDKAEQDLNENETEKQMENASQDASSGEFSKSKKSMQKASQNLQNFANSMKSMKKNMESKNNKEAIKKMQKAVNDMLALSKEQEKLKNNTKNTDYNSVKNKEMATDQAAVEEQLSNVASNLMELSQKSFAVTPEMAESIGNAMQAMQNASSQLSEKMMPNAAASQEAAMGALNNAIGNMQSMIAQMQKTGSCSNPFGSGDPKPGNTGAGMSQKLQQMAAQQQMINQAMQQMGENQGSLSQEQRAQMGRIANQQGNAQKSLQELAKEQKQFSGSKIGVTDLNRLAKEMEEVVKDLKQGKVTPETKQKQERILSRLLDASKALTERDFENQRESKTADDIFKLSPKNLDLNSKDGKKQGLQDLLKSFQKGYSKDYEILIKQYFETLEKNPTSN